MVKRIWLLKSGALDLDKSILVNGTGYGNRMRVSVFSTLLKMEEGYILVDTGQNPCGIDDPERTWGPRAKLLVPVINKEDDIRNRLAEIGVRPEEVTHIITTHMHWDHTGGNQFFKHATVVVQKAEYRFAHYPDSYLSGSYMKNHFDFDQKYQLIEGDYQLCPGIELLFTPGHTQGHQSVLITMEDGGKVIISGDAIYTYENIERRLPPGNCWNGAEAMMSLQRLITIAKLTDAVIIPSHDPEPRFFEKVENFLERRT
jgi:N-acyl homoserine lactone hydrolase